jgi:23S rRNA (cytosine1962-C5)-methyltransferase
MNNTKVVLKSGKEQSLKRFHPWVFSGAIKKIYGEVSEGQYVDVYSNKDEFLGTGHYQIGSIAVRILSFEDIEINSEFWFNKISGAYNYRKIFHITDNPENNVYRLIHGEGDSLPGLIIDFYNGTVVLQMHSIGMFLEKDKIVDVLKNIYKDDLYSVYNKSESTLPYKSEKKCENSYLYKSKSKKEDVTVTESGLKFNIDWVKGQKTGFFIDQRENRKLLETYSKGKNVANIFGYTGGFSVYAMRGGAKLVHTIDSSAGAIEMTEKNISMNFTGDTRHQGFAQDAFEFMEKSNQLYNLIILDPPAFAKHQNVLQNALQGYKRLNQKALEIIDRNSLLFTFSCSQVVSRENFKKSVFAAAANAHRNVRIIHQLSHPIDHPVNIFHPESEYLKGFVLYVD